MPTGSIVFPTLAVHEMNNAQAAWCWLIRTCDTITLTQPRDQADVGSSQSPTAPQPALTPGLADAAASVAAADRAATLIAARALPDYATTGAPTAPGLLGGLGAVQGPSAGLATALYLLDVRTPGDLTGGLDIAATGSITAQGLIGPIGGLNLKARSVSATDADVFFVPQAIADQAAGVRDDLVVVGVSDLTDALAWLCEHQAGRPFCAT